MDKPLVAQAAFGDGLAATAQPRGDFSTLTEMTPSRPDTKGPAPEKHLLRRLGSAGKKLLKGIVLWPTAIVVFSPLLAYLLWKGIQLGSRRLMRALWEARTHYVTWLSLLFFAVAVWGIILWNEHVLRPWDPNIVTSSLSIGLTISIVNVILRQDTAKRVRPRVDRALRQIDGQLSSLFRAIASDYAITHCATFKPIPEMPLEMLDLWLDESRNIDAPRVPIMEPPTPSIPAEVHRFGMMLESVRTRDSEVLDPLLVSALDAFPRLAPEARPMDAETQWLAILVRDTKSFVTVFTPYAKSSREVSRAIRDLSEWESGWARERLESKSGRSET
jgi:hypothetical protein